MTRLATFCVHDSVPAVGLVDGGTVTHLRAVNGRPVTDMMDCIRNWETQPGRREPDFHVGETFDLDAVTLCAPIARPGKIMALGLNYRDHAAEAGVPPPSEQVWFSKPATAVAPPRGTVDLPAVSSQLDYEAELVVVIGRSCRHVSRNDAADVVFGYCVGDDLSVRDWQRRTSQVTIGKSFDTHAPFGPWITIADGIDPHALTITSTVNGEPRQASTTAQMIFDCWSMIETLTAAMTLEPGDLIFTGTPAGVGTAMHPPRYLVAGDVVTVEIESLGSISNTVVQEQITNRRRI